MMIHKIFDHFNDTECPPITNTVGSVTNTSATDDDDYGDDGESVYGSIVIAVLYFSWVTVKLRCFYYVSFCVPTYHQVTS